jgi:hypothetical protein
MYYLTFKKAIRYIAALP